MRGGPDGPVVAEVSARDRVRRISVSAGRYLVRGRASRYLLEGMVTLRGVHGPQAGLRGRSGLLGTAACLDPYLGDAIETPAATSCRGCPGVARPAARARPATARLTPR